MTQLPTVPPALLLAEGESNLNLEGGTHIPFAPPVDFLEKVYLLSGSDRRSSSAAWNWLIAARSSLSGSGPWSRLPSRKFTTNALVLSLGLVGYNDLRLCGQTGLQQN